MLGCMFLLLGLTAIWIEYVGSHGHFMFRPWMLEDWIIWGTIILSETIACTLLIIHFKNRNRSKQQ